jgi:hypothetical protein
MLIKYERNINIYTTKNIIYNVYMALVMYKNNKIIKQWMRYKIIKQWMIYKLLNNK